MEKQKKRLRIDVIKKIERLTELMSRTEGASVKEICTATNFSSRTFYRHLLKLEKLGFIIESKQDENLPTNSKRYYIKNAKQRKTLAVKLTASENYILEDLLNSEKQRTETEQSLYEKLSKAVLNKKN